MVVSLNSRLESNKEEEDHLVFGFLAACNALRDNLAIHVYS